MSGLSGPTAAFALLLVLAGVTKIRRPMDTVRALRALRLPAAALVVRLLALSEIVIGSAVVVFGGPLPALLMALSYLGFAGFVLVAMTKGAAVSSCGCFGTPDTPPTVTHLLVSLAAAGIGGLAVVYPSHPLLTGLESQPLLGVPFTVFTGCCIWFAYVALTVLPKTAAYTRRSS